MAYVSLRMTEQEKTFLDDYARLNGSTISDVVKRAVFEKIEDELDIAVARDYIERKARGKVRYFSHEEVGKRLGLK
jgi:predicted DNA-binding protein